MRARSTITPRRRGEPAGAGAGRAGSARRARSRAARRSASSLRLDRRQRLSTVLRRGVLVRATCAVGLHAGRRASRRVAARGRVLGRRTLRAARRAGALAFRVKLSRAARRSIVRRRTGRRGAAARRARRARSGASPRAASRSSGADGQRAGEQRRPARRRPSGGRRGSPGRSVQPSALSSASCSGRSMPSATVCRSSSRPRPSSARVRRASASLGRGDELAVELEDVDREAAQVAPPRVAGADVVERQAHAEVLEREERGGGGVEVGGQLGLGELEDEQRRVDAGVLDRGGDVVDQVRVLELVGREVDRDGQRLAVAGQVLELGGLAARPRG